MTLVLSGAENARLLPLADGIVYMELCSLKRPLTKEEEAKLSGFEETIRKAKDAAQPLSHSKACKSCARTLIDLRVVAGITLLTGAVLLAASLVFALGLAALLIASLLLAAGVGTGAYSVYSHFNANKQQVYSRL